MNTLPSPPLPTAKRGSVDHYLDSVDHLPPTPALLVKLIGLFRQPDRDVDEVVRLMSQDPALTAEVLRRCNSSFIGDDQPVTEINDAVFRLGFYEVYRISVTLFGLQALPSAKVISGLEVEKLWQHSAYAAIVGGALSRELNEFEGAVFTAGLLHDVGKIVFATADGPRYSALLQQHGSAGAGLYEGEKSAFGFTHAELGARLLERWGVPEEVSLPVRFHHQVERSQPYSRLAALVNLANVMAHFIEDHGVGELSALPAATPALELLELPEKDLPGLMELARSDVKRLHSSLVAQPSR